MQRQPASACNPTLNHAMKGRKAGKFAPEPAAVGSARGRSPVQRSRAREVSVPGNNDLEILAGHHHGVVCRAIELFDQADEIVLESRLRRRREGRKRLQHWPVVGLAQLPHFGLCLAGKPAEDLGCPLSGSNCGAKNRCPSEGLFVLTGSTTVCWHARRREAFRSAGRQKSRLCHHFRSVASPNSPTSPGRCGA